MKGLIIMKKNAVVIVGAGSTHTPGIIQSLLQKKDDFPLRKLALFNLFSSISNKANFLKRWLSFKKISLIWYWWEEIKFSIWHNEAIY